MLEWIHQNMEPEPEEIVICCVQRRATPSTSRAIKNKLSCFFCLADLIEHFEWCLIGQISKLIDVLHIRNLDRLTARDIQIALSGNDDESFFFEFKSDDEDPSKLVKEISALANTYGGYIFLGVNDDKSVGGCKKWTEQRIHTTIHDSLSPTPNFDVRRFKIEGKTVFVIKVEEGTLPPYITGKGAIYERLSSGSFPIKDSAKLTQLYNKRADQEARVKSKIEFGDGDIDVNIAHTNNLCGYIDIGFSVTCSEDTYLQKNPTIDLAQQKTEEIIINRTGTDMPEEIK